VLQCSSATVQQSGPGPNRPVTRPYPRRAQTGDVSAESLKSRVDSDLIATEPRENLDKTGTKLRQRLKTTVSTAK
jgi:hypothetical protein